MIPHEICQLLLSDGGAGSSKQWDLADKIRSIVVSCLPLEHLLLARFSLVQGTCQPLGREFSLLEWLVA
jgi:hypothetical protein